MATIQNGRLVGDIPDSGIFGDELAQGLNPGRGRRAVLVRGTSVETIDGRKRYSKQDLISKRTGKSVRLKTMPDRTKG